MSPDEPDRLAAAAWEARANARVIGPIKVGAAVRSEDGSIFAGCNVEHRYRSHDIHAEVSAIASLVASGRRTFQAIMVVAEREYFTPCGACLDWIFEFGGPGVAVLVQSGPGGRTIEHTATQLMPFYPR